MKKLISLVVVLSLVFGTVGTAFGMENDNELVGQRAITMPVITNEITVPVITEEILSEELTIRAVDYPNGDACTYMIENGEIIYSSFLDRSSGEITNTDYVSETVETKKVNKGQRAKINKASASYIYTTVGTIPYKLSKTTQGETTTVSAKLTVERSVKSQMGGEYDIKGKYKNKADLVSTLSSILAIPVAILFPAASSILTYVGLTGTALNYSIPSFYVRDDCETITWHGVGCSESSVIQGKKHNLIYPNGKTEAIYEGNYYPEKSISNKNKELALKLGKLYYTGFTSISVTW